MNRTIKDATVKRFHYDDHDQLRTHLSDFMAAYNFARRLKTLGGLTPYEYICKIWTSEPDRFILNPIHQMPGLNNRSYRVATRRQSFRRPNMISILLRRLCNRWGGRPPAASSVPRWRVLKHRYEGERP